MTDGNPRRDPATPQEIWEMLREISAAQQETDQLLTRQARAADRRMAKQRRVSYCLFTENAPPLQPTQSERIGRRVPLDHVAQHDHVHITGQQRRAVSRLRALRPGKAPFAIARRHHRHGPRGHGTQAGSGSADSPTTAAPYPPPPNRLQTPGVAAGKEGPVLILKGNEPDALLIHLDKSLTDTEASVRPALAASLYNGGSVSLGKAAKISGLALNEFVEHLGRQGIEIVRQ